MENQTKAEFETIEQSCINLDKVHSPYHRSKFYGFVKENVSSLCCIVGSIPNKRQSLSSLDMLNIILVKD